MTLEKSLTRSLSILCVDDDPDVREVFKRILGREPGFMVETSPSAEDALERLKVHHFDAIVADFAMPGMDGIGLLKEVRARGLNSVFTIVTGKRLSHIAIDALNNGADFYLHKGPDTGNDMGKLIEFIRTHAVMKKDESTPGEWDRLYASCVEGSTDVIFRLLNDGTFSFANEFSIGFFKRPYDTLLRSSFFVLIPENERSEVINRVQDLTRDKPQVIIEHHVITGDGDSPLLQWKYQGIFSAGKKASEYLVSGRDTESLIRIGSDAAAQPEKTTPGRKTITQQRPAIILSPAPAPVQEPYQAPFQVPPVTVQSPRVPLSAPAPLPSRTPVTAQAPAPADDTGSYDWESLVETVNSLDNPVFAVNKTGTVIAWNRALADLTGVASETIVGKGNREYAVPFYGKPVPMLIDSILPPGNPDGSLGPGVKKTGDTFVGEAEQVWIRDTPMLLWGKGTAIHNAKGELVAALEAITVAEPEKSAPVQEGYIGGIYSRTLKVSADDVPGRSRGHSALRPGATAFISPAGACSLSATMTRIRTSAP